MSECCQNPSKTEGCKVDVCESYGLANGMVDIQVQVGKCRQNPSKTEGFEGGMCESYAWTGHRMVDREASEAQSTLMPSSTLRSPVRMYAYID